MRSRHLLNAIMIELDEIILATKALKGVIQGNFLKYEKRMVDLVHYL